MRLNTTGHTMTVRVTAQPFFITKAPMRQYAPSAASGYWTQRGQCCTERL